MCDERQKRLLWKPEVQTVFPCYRWYLSCWRFFNLKRTYILRASNRSLSTSWCSNVHLHFFPRRWGDCRRCHMPSRAAHHLTPHGEACVLLTFSFSVGVLVWTNKRLPFWKKNWTTEKKFRSGCYPSEAWECHHGVFWGVEVKLFVSPRIFGYSWLDFTAYDKNQSSHVHNMQTFVKSAPPLADRRLCSNSMHTLF